MAALCSVWEVMDVGYTQRCRLFYFLFSISLKKKKSNSLLLCSPMPQHFAVTLFSTPLTVASELLLSPLFEFIHFVSSTILFGFL